MQVELKPQQFKNNGNYQGKPINSYSQLEWANIYASFILKVDNGGKCFLNQCFGADFCKMVDALIAFNLKESDKKLEDVEAIRFYECRSGRNSKTMISRIKFK